MTTRRETSRWAFRGGICASAVLLSLVLPHLSYAAEVGATTLHDAIRAAWSIDPLHHKFAVDAKSAERNARAARSWFPDGPTLSGQYYDDHLVGSNQGYTTYQAGISVPLWLPGQSAAKSRNEMANHDVAVTHLAMERMEIAVRVLDLATQAALSDVMVKTLDREDQALRHIDALSRQLLQSGEIGTADRNAVAGEHEQLEADLAQAQEKLADTQSSLQEVTGSSALPDLAFIDGRNLGQAHISDIDLVVDRDPRILYSTAMVNAASAADHLVSKSYMPNPQVGIDTIHEKQYGSPWNTRFGVQLSVPLPSEARSVPMRMNTVREIANAESAQRQAYRMVRAEYLRTRTRLRTSLTIMQHAHARQQALTARLEDLQKAMDVGEVSVIEYLRARHAALDAQQQEQTAIIAWHSAIARLMISAGSPP